MKNISIYLTFICSITLFSCGSTPSTQENQLQSAIVEIENEAILRDQIERGKECVADLSFFQRLYWNGFLDQWNQSVDDNFSTIPEADQAEAAIYEEVLRYHLGCNFAKGDLSEDQIRVWSDQIASKSEEPELILAEIKLVYEEARDMLNF